MLATNSLVKNTWEFLQTHGITLSHDISVPKNTLNDYILMTELCRLTLSHTELDSINQCRLYLKAYYISDLATASGKRLSKHTWQGQPRFEGRTSTCSWPTQARPSNSAWIIWRNTLKRTILSRGLLLKTAIGPWLRNDLDIWKWYYAPAVDCLLEVKPNETLLYYRNTKSVANNTFGPVGKKIEEFPRHLQKASVEPLKRGLFQLIDTGELSTPQQSLKPPSFHSFLENPHKYNQWCFDFLHIPSHYESIIQDLKDGAVWLVSDGSYHLTLHYGTAAWILEGSTTNIKLIGRVITPGQASDLSAYRCKLSGILAAITFINTLASYHEVLSEITIQCDCARFVKGHPARTQESVCYLEMETC
jgi:hypothetical protein